MPQNESTIVKLKEVQREPEDEQQKKLREIKDREKEFLKEEERNDQKNANSTNKFMKSGLVYDYNGTIIERKQNLCVKGLSTPMSVECRQVACTQKKSGKTTERKFITPSKTEQHEDNEPVDNLDAQKLRSFIDSMNLSKGVCFEGCSFNIDFSKPKLQNEVDILNNISQIKEQNKQLQSLNNTIYDLPEGWINNLKKNTSRFGDSLIVRQDWKNNIKKQFRISNRKQTQKSKFQTNQQESLSPVERYDLGLLTSENWGKGKSVKRIENQTTYNSLHQKLCQPSNRVRNFRKSHLIRKSLANLRI